jgi:3-hydroxy-9,10-secoandrosta-1,3,5(10)-triene-9,17-dione monooxygenase reductase component
VRGQRVAGRAGWCTGAVIADGPGGAIHPEHPFATPAGERNPLRRLRGRVASPVTLWTAADGGRRYGLTVSATLVVDGDPARVVGMVDPDSDLWDAVAASGRFAVTVLGWRHRQLADRFAGLLPAPGGLFAQDDWEDAGWGPVPAGAPGWLGCRLDADAPLGWSRQVTGTVQRVALGEDEPALLYRRGRYHRLDQG